MRTYSEDEYLPLSGIQHFVFCKRQWALICIEQIWLENYLTMEGRNFHETAHNAMKTENRGDILITRGLPIHSPLLGLSGICDVVEFHKAPEGVKIHGRNGFYTVLPIEYKRGRAKVGDEDVLQVVAQSMCLEEMLYTTIGKAYLFYGSTRRRHEIDIDETKRHQVNDITQQMHEMWESQLTPKPIYENKCHACSLFDVCLPKLNNKPASVEKYMNGYIDI